MTARLPAFKRSDDPLVGIVSLVRDQGGGGDVRQQRVRADKIMRLAGGQLEGYWVAEGIDHGMDLGAQPAFAAADCLIDMVFFGAPALC
jgi:hypothetical protein